MFELTGTNFQRGVFELRMEEAPPAWLRWAIRLGPFKGRLIGLALILSSAALTYYRQPAQLFVEHGWVNSTLGALKLQSFVTWGITALGVLIYLFVFFVRQEALELTFDRSHSELRYRHTPMGTKNPVTEGLIPFKDIRAVEAKGAEAAPQTPFGYIEVKLAAPEESPIGNFRFRVLSEDQFKIYPQNIRNMMGMDSGED